MFPHTPKQIISGGQTGADRAGLDAAIELGIPVGGWCPRGRRAEDGEIPPRYPLKETDSPAYPVRTEKNIVESDATLIFLRGRMRGGCLLTFRLCKMLKKPVNVIDCSYYDLTQGSVMLRTFLKQHQPECLNVAGSRSSGAPGIYDEVKRLLIHAFKAQGTVCEEPDLFDYFSTGQSEPSAK